MSRSRSLSRRALALLVAAAAVATGVVVATPATAAPAGCTTTGTGVTHCEGSLDGAAYLVDVPPNWAATGRKALLWSHGYRFAYRSGSSTLPALGRPATDPNVTAENVPVRGPATETLRTALLAQGYAVLGSSYGRNGWAVQDGVRANAALLTWFREGFGAPGRTYAWGESLGGLVTQMFAQRYPGLVDGVAPMCGVLGGTNENLDIALDVAAAVRYFFAPTMRIMNFSSLAEADRNLDLALTNITTAVGKSEPGAVAKLLAIAAIADLPLKTRTQDASTLTSQVKAIVEVIVNALAYGTEGRYELERRVGGPFSTNLGVDYRKRISAADLAMFGRTGLPSSLLTSYVGAFNYFGVRLAFDPTARARAGALGRPSGKLWDKTVTLHTAYDPLVGVQNESLFAYRTRLTGSSANLRQFYISPPASYGEGKEPAAAPYGAGHCVFSGEQMLGLVRVLDTWVSGAAPTYTSVRTAFADVDGDRVGLDFGFRVPAWPAR